MTDPEQMDDGAGLQAFTESVQALSASVGQLTSEGRRSRRLIRWTIAGVILDLTLTVVVGLLFNGQRTTNDKLRHTQAQLSEVLHSDCPFFGDLGTAALPPQASKFGLKLVADSRIAYYTHGCQDVSGKLAKPDPRLLPYLPPYAQ